MAFRVCNISLDFTHRIWNFSLSIPNNTATLRCQFYLTREKSTGTKTFPNKLNENVRSQNLCHVGIEVNKDVPSILVYGDKIRNMYATRSTAGLGSTNNKLCYQIEWLELCEKLFDPALVNVRGRTAMDNGRDIVLIRSLFDIWKTKVYRMSVFDFVLFELFQNCLSIIPGRKKFARVISNWKVIEFVFVQLVMGGFISVPQ